MCVCVCARAGVCVCKRERERERERRGEGGSVRGDKEDRGWRECEGSQNGLLAGEKKLYFIDY